MKLISEVVSAIPLYNPTYEQVVPGDRSDLLSDLLSSLRIKKSLISKLPIFVPILSERNPTKSEQKPKKLNMQWYKNIRNLYKSKHNYYKNMINIEKLFNSCTVDLIVYNQRSRIDNTKLDKFVYTLEFHEGPYGYHDNSKPKRERSIYIIKETCDIDGNVIRQTNFSKLNTRHIADPSLIVYSARTIMNTTDGGVNKYDYQKIKKYDQIFTHLSCVSLITRLIKNYVISNNIETYKEFDKIYHLYKRGTFTVEYEHKIADMNITIVEYFTRNAPTINVDPNHLHKLPRDIQTSLADLHKNKIVDNKVINKIEYKYTDDKGDVVDHFLIDSDNKYKSLLVSKTRKYGYKVAKLNDGSFCIVKLLLLDDSLLAGGSSLNKLRTNKCIPVCIGKVDLTSDPKKYTITELVLAAKSCVYVANGSFVYVVDKLIEIADFNKHLGSVCVPGIHYFNTINETCEYMRGSKPFVNANILTDFEVPTEYYVDMGAKLRTSYKKDLKTSVEMDFDAIDVQTHIEVQSNIDNTLEIENSLEMELDNLQLQQPNTSDTVNPSTELEQNEDIVMAQNIETQPFEMPGVDN